MTIVVVRVKGNASTVISLKKNVIKFLSLLWYLFRRHPLGICLKYRLRALSDTRSRGATSTTEGRALSNIRVQVTPDATQRLQLVIPLLIGHFIGYCIGHCNA